MHRPSSARSPFTLIAVLFAAASVGGASGCVQLLDMPDIVEREPSIDGDDGGATGGSADPTGGAGGSTGERHHPAGFDAATAHGPAAATQSEDCRACHGAQLDGGSSGVGCDDCHQAGWRSQCTYCHGGEGSTSGAPPRDAFDHAAPSFAAHTAHVSDAGHMAFACSQCHAQPTDVLTPGHLFDDDTPGAAEVTFAAGLSPAGSYDGAGGCANLYCHGTGRGDDGTVADGATTPSCNDCHPGPGGGGFAAMSGDHSRHLGDGMTCDDCHQDTVQGTTIIGAMLHVNGEVDFAPDAAVTLNNGSCNGTCHGHGHNGDNW